MIKKVLRILKDLEDFNDFDDFKRLSEFIIWISMDLHHKILKDLKWFYGFIRFQKILWILKRNNHTHSLLQYSGYQLFYLFIYLFYLDTNSFIYLFIYFTFMFYERAERGKREEERREDTGRERERERDRKREGERESLEER